MDENNEKTIRSEISELKEAVVSQGQKIDKIQERIGRDIKDARERMSKHIDDFEKEKKKKMQEIKYIGVEFDPKGVKQGQDEVNSALKVGFEPIRDFETAKGIVMVLGLWGDHERTD
jgi:vacuolar-type H+-ATPase subunit H